MAVATFAGGTVVRSGTLRVLRVGLAGFLWEKLESINSFRLFLNNQPIWVDFLSDERRSDR